jgi:hypothetical protein
MWDRGVGASHVSAGRPRALGVNRTPDPRFRKPREHVGRVRLRDVPAGSGAGCISVGVRVRTLLATSWPQLSRGTRARSRILAFLLVNLEQVERRLRERQDALGPA